jgi:hypothetical protein
MHKELPMFSSRVKIIAVVLIVLAIAVLPYLVALAELAPGGGH